MPRQKRCEVCSAIRVDNGKPCPCCGNVPAKNPVIKRIVFWGIVVFLFLVVVSILGSAGKHQNKFNEGFEKGYNKATENITKPEENKKETSKTDTSKTETAKKETPKAETSEKAAAKTDSAESKSVPTEYKSALKKAQTYSSMMHMSKAGLYDQLTSEYGEQFSAEAAKYAIDNVNADWKQNALKKAEIYQNDMAMSPSAIYDQLISEYGEKFTPEEAQYAIDNLK